MAAYCDIDDLEATLAGAILLGEDTKPSRATAEAEILSVGSQLNVALAMGEVALPIDPSLVDLIADLSRLNRREAAYQVRAMAQHVNDKDKDPLWVGWHKEFLDALALMREGTLSNPLQATPRWREEDVEADWLRVKAKWDEKIVTRKAGYLIKNVLNAV